MIDVILSAIRQAGGTISILDGDLRLRVPKGLLSPAEQLLLAKNKAAIITLFSAETVIETPVEKITGNMTEPVVSEHRDQHGDMVLVEVDPPAACQQCGSLMLWWDILDGTYCLICEPMERSRQLLDDAARLRARSRRLLQFRDRNQYNGRSRQGVTIPNRLLTTTQT
jgi:hypothetical protein